MSNLLERLADYHDEWLKIAVSFVKDYDLANDLVQDMYVLIDRRNVNLEDIRYNDDINKYFIYRVIKNIIGDYWRKQKKHDALFINMEAEVEDESLISYLAMDVLFDKVYKEVDSWNTYDKNLFELYMHTNLSLRDLAGGTDKKDIKLISATKKIHDKSLKTGTGISVSSMFNTIKNCKEILRDKFQSDFDNYFDAQYDKIL